MAHLKVGDNVSVLHETVTGVLIEIQEEIAIIEDEHGFNLKYPINQIVKRQSDADYKLKETDLSKDIRSKIEDQLVEIGTRLKSYEIDLHIEELIDNHSNMTNHEILTKQMNACRHFIQSAIEKGMPKIVLIHGKGEGVLKAEIHSYLNKLRNYNGVHLMYHDASFAEYGMGGATEVVFN